jgi:hypothetical protein
MAARAQAGDGGSSDPAAQIAPEFAAAAQYSHDLVQLLRAHEGEESSSTTLSMAQLSAAVHSWQLPFCALLLAYSRDPAALIAVTDACERGVSIFRAVHVD